MEKEKPWLDPELTLSDLAAQFQLNPVQLSALVNNGIGKNFNDFVNEYRVEAIKKRLDAGASKQFSLLGIAYECGFNSKATFNRAFKKHAGVTPGEYKG
jgi:YesN/AraC family two-component response regulator